MRHVQPYAGFGLGYYVRGPGDTRAPHKTNETPVTLPRVSILESGMTLTPDDYYAGKAAQAAAERRFPRRFLAKKLRKPSLRRTTPAQAGAPERAL